MSIFTGRSTRVALLFFVLPSVVIAARGLPEPQRLPPSSPQADVALRPADGAVQTLPAPDQLTGLSRITAATVDRLTAVAWLEPGRVLMPGWHLADGSLGGETPQRFDLFARGDAGLWFYGDEAGSVFGVVRERGDYDAVFHAFDLQRGLYERLTLSPPYALAPSRPLLAGQQGMLRVVPLFGWESGGVARLLSESSFLTWAGDHMVIMDNSMESVFVTVDGVQSPWPLPEFSSHTDSGAMAAYPVAHDRVYPAPVALADGTVIDVNHRLSGDALWWWGPRPEVAGTPEYMQRHELPLDGQVIALDARDSESLVAVIVTDDRGTALRVYGPGTITNEPAGRTDRPVIEVPLDRRRWQWGSAVLISDRLAAVSDDDGLLLIVSLSGGGVLRTLGLPAPVVQAASAGDRLIGLSLGREHPGVLLGVR